MNVTLTITAEFEIPDTAQPVYAKDGTCIGFTLEPNTDSPEILKPWIVWEATPTEGDPFDLTLHEHVETRGIVEMNFARRFEGFSED